MPTPEEQYRLSITTSFAFVLTEVGSAAIQLFMWFYIFSYFLRASRDVQKSRGLYLGVSGLLTSFSVACAAITSVSRFEVLYTVSGLPTELKGNTQIRMYDRLWIKGDLLRVVSIGIGDALLVSITRTFSLTCVNHRDSSGIPMLHYLLRQRLDDGSSTCYLLGEHGYVA